MLGHIAEGLIRPRDSVERLLRRKPGVGDAALMVVAAYVLQRAMDIVSGRGAGAVNLFEHVVSLVLAIAYTFVIGFPIYSIGRAFGGHATREQSLVVAGWHALVMTLLWPLLLIGVGEVDLASPDEISPGALLVLALYFSLWVWLLARYTAAVHGFESDWRVLGVIVGVLLLVSSLMLAVAGA